MAWGLIDATKVILWPDADDPGLAHMRLVAERLPHGSEALWANTEGLFDGQGAADCTLAGRQRRVSEAAHLADGQEAAGKTSPTTLLAALQDAFKLIEQRSQNPGALPGLSTGLRDLDDTTDGLIGGEVTVIAGRPSMGKTALALQIAEHVAAQDKHVLIASLEMSPVEIATRLLSGKSGISQKALRRGVLKTGDWRKLTEAGNSMSLWRQPASDIPRPDRGRHARPVRRHPGRPARGRLPAAARKREGGKSAACGGGNFARGSNCWPWSATCP